MSLSTRLEPIFKRAEKQAAQEYAYFHALNETYLTEDPSLDEAAHEAAWNRHQLYEQIGSGSALRAFNVLARDTDDETLGEWAEQRAHAVAKLAALNHADPWMVYAQARNYAGRYGVEAPTPVQPGKKGETIASAINKLKSSKWWKLTMRRVHVRKWETRELDANAVNALRMPCASDFAVNFVRQRRESTRQMLLNLYAINEAGTEVCLGEAAESSTANPTIRRMEMMARLKGMETVAEERGDVGLFVSWTLASRWHRHKYAGGKTWPNPKYDGASLPRDGHAELNTQWQRVRAVLHKKGLKVYGFRCAEPHHDATPHWHMVLFVPRKADMKTVMLTIRKYALKESPDEPGASIRRVKFKMISKDKGGAVAYMAKYVAKNVDGFALDHAATPDDDGQMQFAGVKDPVVYAERVTAWARLWGIRQFQFFGLPSITPYRELRRIREVQMDLPLIEPIRFAADDGDVAQYIRLQGGPLVKRMDQPIKTYRDDKPFSALTGFGAYKPHNVLGVRHDTGLESMLTRLHTWTIEIRSPEVGTDFGPPWTRVTNCNQPETGCPSQIYPQSIGKPHEPHRSDPRKWSHPPT